MPVGAAAVSAAMFAGSATPLGPLGAVVVVRVFIRSLLNGFAKWGPGL